MCNENLHNENLLTHTAVINQNSLQLKPRLKFYQLKYALK